MPNPKTLPPRGMPPWSPKETALLVQMLKDHKSDQITLKFTEEFNREMGYADDNEKYRNKQAIRGKKDRMGLALPRKHGVRRNRCTLCGEWKLGHICLKADDAAMTTNNDDIKDDDLLNDSLMPEYLKKDFIGSTICDDQGGLHFDFRAFMDHTP